MIHITVDIALLVMSLIVTIDLALLVMMHITTHISNDT